MVKKIVRFIGSKRRNVVKVSSEKLFQKYIEEESLIVMHYEGDVESFVSFGKQVCKITLDDQSGIIKKFINA